MSVFRVSLASQDRAPFPVNHNRQAEFAEGPYGGGERAGHGGPPHPPLQASVSPSAKSSGGRHETEPVPPSLMGEGARVGETEH